MIKYIKIPLASTIVVIAGLAAIAGSPLSHFIKNGNIVPIKVAVITCNADDKATIKERLYKLQGYKFDLFESIITFKKAKKNKHNDNKKPTFVSLKIIENKLFMLICFNNNALITTVAAWLPTFPPISVIIGIYKDNTVNLDKI